MPDRKELAGLYVGRCRVRDGKESELAPAERKRFVKNAEPLMLELRSDGTFHYKGTTEGTYEVAGEAIMLRPISFHGMTEEQMRQAAEEAGRSFGLSWLFAPFQLKIRDRVLVGSDDRALIYPEYVREGP